MRRLTKQQRWRTIFVMMAALSILATVAPALTSLRANMSMKKREAAAAASTTTSTTPAFAIKPLPVRLVVSAFVTTPDQCPPSMPAPPPDKPARVCDIAKTAVYELSPESMQVQLTGVELLRNPVTDVQLVQMNMTAESARKFGEFTGGQAGKQVAFVRGGTVGWVWDPKISAPINGEVLQLSGDMTPEQADELANTLREDS